MAAEKEATLILKIKEAGSAVLDKLVFTFGDLKDIALKAFDALKKPIEAYREQEVAVNKLTQAMVNAGVYTAASRDQNVALAESLQKVSTYGDETIISAMGVLQANARGLKITEELTKATMDLAAAKGMDLASAAELVGKTLGTETNALMRQGIQIDMTLSKTERMAAVIEGISEKYKDQAKAQAEGLGIMTKFANQMSDLQEDLGEALAPTLIVIVRTLSEMFTKTEDGVNTVKILGEGFVWLTKIVLGVKAIFDELGAAIGIGLAAAVESINAVMKGQFKRAGEIWKEADAMLAADQEKRAIELGDKLNALDERRYSQKNVLRAQDEENERMSAANKQQIMIDDQAARMEKQMEIDTYVMSLQGQTQEQQLALQIAFLDKKISNEQNSAKKIELLKAKSEAQLQLQNISYQQQQQAFDNKMLQAKTDTFGAAMNLMGSLAADGSAVQFYAAKAAALAQAIVSAHVASGLALASPPGPPATIPLSNWAFATGMLNVAAIGASTIKGAGKFAEGGIVKARPGGMLGIIGEAGRDEAVIPLENGQIPGSGGGSITIVVYGGLLGDSSQAREFAVAVDKELFRLRQSNESLAFDSGVV